MQVVRARPNVKENKRPKVDNAEFVTEDRSLCGLGQKVVHQPEERRRQEERDGVVAVPPLHQCILHASVDRVAFTKTNGYNQIIEDVQHRDSHDGRYVEPQRHVHVTFSPIPKRHEKIATEES